MTRAASTDARVYVYAVTPADVVTAGAIGGLDGEAVYRVVSGGLAALVSPVPPKLRPERRHLTAHQAVLKQIATETTLLPMTFGVVLKGPDAVRRMLSRNQQALLQQIERVEGCVEMGLRVAWDVPNIFEYFVDRHTELRQARDRCFGRHREPTFDERIEVGRLFEELLADGREAHTASIEELLAPHCREMKRLKPRHEREIANLACLVERARKQEFEAAMFDVAGHFDNNFAFDYNGPWAPHNFVELRLEAGVPAGR